jgi:diguanylate cyclase (GGDEF)-like protein/PAS domain S-box-containing protein
LADAVIVADATGVIRIYNPAAEQMFQYAADLALNDNLYFLLDSLLSEADQDRVNDALRSHRPVENMRVQILDLSKRQARHVLLTISFRRAAGANGVVVATMKDNSETEKLARTDVLTGLANRRELEGRLQRDQARLRRSQLKSIACIFIDVDHFATFNRQYGHRVGDLVLAKVGEVLASCVRGVDMAARYGGEEFVVVLPDTDEDGAMLVAERIRTTLEQTRVAAGVHQSLSITASVGVRTHTGVKAEMDKVVDDAGAAMRMAKQAGRNLVVSYGCGARSVRYP